MNGSQMKYDFYAPEYKGSLILDYTLTNQQWDDYENLYVVFKELRVNQNSTFLSIYDGNFSPLTRIDSIPNLANVMTELWGTGPVLMLNFKQHRKRTAYNSRVIYAVLLIFCITEKQIQKCRFTIRRNTIAISVHS